MAVDITAKLFNVSLQTFFSCIEIIGQEWYKNRNIQIATAIYKPMSEIKSSSSLACKVSKQKLRIAQKRCFWTTKTLHKYFLNTVKEFGISDSERKI